MYPGTRRSARRRPCFEHARAGWLGVSVGGSLCILVACESRPLERAREAPSTPAAPPPRAAPESVETPAPRPEERPPLEFLEVHTAGASANARLPLVIAIHGLGDTPQGFAPVIAELPVPARVLLPQAPTAYSQGYAWFRFRPGRTEEELAEGISEGTERVAAFVDWARKARPTSGLPVITGFSQGGMLSFALAVRLQDRLKAAIPVSGGLPRPLWPSTTPPPNAPQIIAFHGEDDTVVPPSSGEKSIAHLAQLGFPATYRSFPGVGHSIPTSVRRALHEALRDAIARPAP
jgi:phospholipase/carboxylesterase